MIIFELFELLFDIIMQNEFLHFVIQILYSKSLPNSTNSRNTSSAALHYLIAGWYCHVVLIVKTLISGPVDDFASNGSGRQMRFPTTLDH